MGLLWESDSQASLRRAGSASKITNLNCSHHDSQEWEGRKGKGGEADAAAGSLKSSSDTRPKRLIGASSRNLQK